MFCPNCATENNLDVTFCRVCGKDLRLVSQAMVKRIGCTSMLAGMQIPGFRISWTSTDVTLSPDGKLAYMFSQNAVTMNAPDGTPVTTKGRAVTVWRRESDGEWRCAVDIWNS